MVCFWELAVLGNVSELEDDVLQTSSSLPKGGTDRMKRNNGMDAEDEREI